MGWSRTSGVLLVCAASALSGGCGKDFDALFANGPDAPADGGDGGDGRDGGDGGPAACSPPATDCKPKSGTDDGRSTYTCSGCGCTCPPATCAPSSKGCNGSCGAGATCDLGCDTEGPCNLSCKGCKGAFDCGDNTKTCTVTCNDSASCQSKCGAEETCTLACKGGSACLLSCTSKPTACDLECDGVKKECGNRVYACNRECP
jgi:hypothetical protein